MLDIKLKSNKYIVNIIVTIVLLIASIGICLLYPKIEKDSKNMGYNIFENQFLEDISKTNYALYFQMYKENSDKKLKPSDIMLDLNLLNKSQNEDEYENFKSIFDDDIYSWYEMLPSNLSNLEYYAINKENEEVKQKTKGRIGDLVNDSSSANVLAKLKEKYSFYTVLDYDDKGDLKIEQIHGANKESILRSIKNIQKDDPIGLGYMADGFEVKPIKDMKFIYAVPKNISGYDNIVRYQRWEDVHSHNMASLLYINIALSFVVIAGILIPYKELKELTGFKKIVKIPIEIVVILVCLGIGFIYASSEIIMVSSIKEELIISTQIQLSKDFIILLTYLINVIYWFISFTLILIGILTLKHIYKSGIKSYIKDNCLIYKILDYIIKNIKDIYKWCTNIEFSKKDNKKIMSILVINLLILILMCSIWFFGIILAIIYTIILGILIKKYYVKVKDDYSKLLNLTNEISSGNLDIDTSEDIGTFNVLKEEIVNIKNGFKKAVEKEVKSQKMKTELISNVSHDLKTPLTSIITYTDLLKDENLSIDKRRLYLDTLDRKAQRLQILIEDLFEVSKATSGNISLNKVDVDIVSLMKQTLLELDDKIKVSKLLIRNSYSKEKIILSLDSQHMFRVFENLIINITKYSMEGSRVYIDILDYEDYVQISLKNMTKDEITFNADELVERFIRGDKSRNTEGSGLGLAISKSFVELQGGNFNVDIDGDLFKVVIKFNK